MFISSSYRDSSREDSSVPKKAPGPGYLMVSAALEEEGQQQVRQETSGEPSIAAIACDKIEVSFGENWQALVTDCTVLKDARQDDHNFNAAISEK